MTAPREDQSDDEVLMAAAAYAVRRHLAGYPTAARQLDDLFSDARFGAATASLRYDPAGGATLFTYALHRARGAIADGIRDRSPMSRTEFARDPDPAAVMAQRTPLSIDELAASGWTAPSPRTGLEQTEDHDQVLRLLQRCTPTEQLLLVAVEMYGFTQTDVARWLGVSLARVNQIHRRVLARLRAVVSA